MTTQQILAHAKSNSTEIRIVKFLPKDNDAFMSIWKALTSDNDYTYKPDTRWLRIGRGTSFTLPYGYDDSPYSCNYPETNFISDTYIFTRKPHA